MEKRIELNCKTNHSPYESVIRTEEIYDVAKGKNLEGIAVLDNGRIDAWKALSGWAKDDIKPIYGASLRLSLDERYTAGFYYLSLLVKNETGKKNLFKLLTLANSREKEYEYNMINLDELALHRQGLLAGWGCENNYLSTDYGRDEEDHVKRIIEEPKGLFDYYEVAPPAYNPYYPFEKPSCRDITNWIVDFAYDIGSLVAAVSCAGYANEDESDAYKALKYAEYNTEGKVRLHPREDMDAHLYDTNEMINAFSFLGENRAREIVIQNPIKIYEKIEFDSPKTPRMYPKNNDDNQSLKEIAYSGAKKIYGNSLPEEVVERLKQELTAIGEGGYESIFLFEKELVSKLGTKRVHSHRGTAANSFISYLCGISDLNPLPPHYRCEKCLYSEFRISGKKPSVGRMLPQRQCPICGKEMVGDGYGLAYEFFIGNEDNPREPRFDLDVASSEKGNILGTLMKIEKHGSIVRCSVRNPIGLDVAGDMVNKYIDAVDEVYDEDTKEKMVSLLSDCYVNSNNVHPGKWLFLPKEYGDLTDYMPVVKDSETFITSVDWHEYDGLLLNVNILSKRSIDFLETLQEKTCKAFPGNLTYGAKLDEILLEDGDGNYMLKAVFSNQYIDKLKTILAIRKDYGFEEFIKIIGLLHQSVLEWDDVVGVLSSAEIKDVISCREDCFDKFLHAGIDRTSAFQMAEGIRKGRWKKGENKQYDDSLRERGVPEWYISLCHNIRYLFPRSVCIEEAIAKWNLLFYKRYHANEFYQSYIDIWGNEDEKRLIRKGGRMVADRISKLKNIKKDMGDIDKICAVEGEIELLEVAQEMFMRGYAYR